MKILKIDKLNHARFHNYTWHPKLAPFSSSLNLLFGWNGSGKTTFSKVMRMLELGKVMPGCIFKVKTDTSDITEISNFSSVSGNIRVFNDDYIDEMLKGSDKLPYIFFAGKEAVSYEVEEKNLKDKKNKYVKIVLPTAHEEIAKRTAIIIKEVAGINSIKKELIGASTYASYDKSDFEKRILNIEQKIAKGSIKSHTDLIRQDIDSLKSQLVNTEHMAKNNRKISEASQWLLDNIDYINSSLKECPQQVHSKRIGSLEDYQRSWIKQGVSLHFDPRKPIKKCLFCDSTIRNTNELTKHFTEAVVNLINSIDGYLKTIESYTTELSRLDSLTSSQQSSVDFIRNIFDQLTIIIQEKRGSTIIVKSPFTIDKEKVLDLSKPVVVDATSIAYAIEAHFVAQQYEEYLRNKTAFIKAVSDKKDAESEISKLDLQVRSLKQKVKNTHEPAQALNRLFKTVFPYRRIEITDSDDGKGYVLKRDGANCPFTTLSEGERNFIALAYFIYSINDVQNKLAEDGVVVIDDPVSSLDKQSIFQIFSIIVSEIKNHPTRQYFLLTHNLDFFGHLREQCKEKIRSKDIHLYSFVATSIGCTINVMHPLLRDHRSDYYYVFSILSKYKDACNQEDAYLVVNLLRRWMETFLEFKFSTSGNLKSTLEMAYSMATKATEKYTTPFSANHLEMYRFISHGSHGFTDTESIDDSILTGAHEKITEALRLVEILDNLHYKKLEAIIKI